MINAKYSKFETIKQKSRDALLSSTIHGVQGIVKETNHLVKLMWLFCLLISITVCGYFVFSSIFNYLEYEVITSIETIYEQQSEFPTVSVCVTKPLGRDHGFNCLFNSNNCSQQIEKFEDQIYKHGCIRFNSGYNRSNMSYDVLNSTVGGTKYGLKIDLYITSESDFSEAIVFIHNKSDKSNYNFDKGFILTSGSVNTIIIERTFDEKLEYPYNNCYKDVNNFKLNRTIIDFFKQNNNSYNVVECIRYCRNLMVLEQSGCNCIESIDSFYKCLATTNTTIQNCYFSFTRRFQTLNVFDICSKYCPYECDSINFSYTINTGQLPVSGNITDPDFITKYKTYQELQKKYIKIIAYYPELRYTYIKQEPRTLLTDLVSNIGGTLGLFLGISFLSFVEIIELIILIISIIVRK